MGWQWGGHSCRGCGFSAASSFEACWAQALKVVVLSGLQILGSGAPHLARSNVSVICPSPRLLRGTFDLFGQENISLQEQQALSWFFLRFHVLSCFLRALCHIVVHPLFPVTDNPHPPTFSLVTHMPPLSHFSFLAPPQPHWISIATCAQTPPRPSRQVAQEFTALVIVSLLSKTWLFETAYCIRLMAKNPTVASGWPRALRSTWMHSD